MKVLRRWSFVAFLNLGCLASCNGVFTKTDLLNYSLDPQNGLYQMKEKNGIRLEVLYRPSGLLAAQEMLNLKLSQAQTDSIKQYFSSFNYFLLRLSEDGKEVENAYVVDRSKFNQINNYLSFEIGNDVMLVIDNDTVRVSEFVHTRTFGSSPSSDILFAFKSKLPERGGIIRFIFNDWLFSTGWNEFEFAISDIKSIPEIHLTTN